MRIRLYESLRAVFYTPFYVAQELGVQAEEGLEVILSRPETSDRAASDLFEGKADVTWGGPMRMMQHMDRDRAPDHRLIAFGEAVTRDPFFLIGNKPNPDFRMSDLTACRLGSVSEVPTPWMCLQEDLQRDCVDPARVDRVADQSMAENAEALRRGDVDVIQVFEPFAETLIQEGAGHLWRAAADRGPTSYTTYYATQAYVRDNREALVRLTRALHRAQTWLHRADIQAISDMVQPYFPDIPGLILAGAINRYRSLGVWGRDPKLPLVGFTRLKVSLISGGFISHDAPYEGCVDQSIINEAMVGAS
ncbi:MAG: ABC transporter substrate-binding protein [Alphaproteobacteria bacterium]|jgi:NitT/TauT family transport system substrate-binding protein